MRLLRKLFGCVVCCSLAIVLFGIAMRGHKSESGNLVPDALSLPSRKDFRSQYETSENEEEMVCHILHLIEQNIAKTDVLVELVDCHFKGWFQRTLYPVLTRSHESFGTDDGFTLDVRLREKHRVVFLCLNFTGRRDRNSVRMTASLTKSNLPRRFDATGLLVLITRHPVQTERILNQLQMYPNDFKEIMHVDASVKTSSPPMIRCVRRLFFKIPFGLKINFDANRKPRSIAECLSDWTTERERKTCPDAVSTTQNIKNLVFEKAPVPLMRVRVISDFEPCFNTVLAFAYTEVTAHNTLMLPLFMESAVSAYAFDRHIPIVGIQGHVINKLVLSIMALLGAAVWFVSGTRFTDAFLDIFCSITSSSQLSKKLKGSPASAACLWILGNMFFSFILVDDMTSTITMPGGSRISWLPECTRMHYIFEPRTVYVGKPLYFFWKDFLVEASDAQRKIICASKFEIDELRRFFDLRSVYKIPLGTHGRKWILRPRSREEVLCPADAGFTKCSIVRSFVDNTEWNNFGIVLLQFDLLRAPILHGERISSRRFQKRIRALHGCCENRENFSEPLVKELASMGYEPPRSPQSRFKLPSMYLVTGVCAVLFCSLVEICTSVAFFLKMRCARSH